MRERDASAYIRGRQTDRASKNAAHSITQQKLPSVRGRVQGSPPALAAAEPIKSRVFIIITLLNNIYYIRLH